ncbi:MAG: Na+/H+ antiporter NhaC [Angelakisella sp.]
MSTKTERQGSFASSLLIMLTAIAVLLFGVVGFKLEPHIPLLFSTGIILIYSVYLCIPWVEMRKTIVKSISESIEAIIIICLIGMTVGSWISSGTVPIVIYYGLKIFSPKFFLISVLILCSIMSIMTGSSWTTIGTIGVAFMGVGYGLGIPMGLTAGAIICGAFFGDKQSPMSDSTNFAAAVAKTDLYAHVRSMLYTTGPALLVSAAFFLITGFSYSNGVADASQVEIITNGLTGAFNLNPILFFPPVLLVVLIIKKFPAIPTMIISTITGMLLTVFVQGEKLSAALSYMHTGFVGVTGIAPVDKLLTRGGLNSMTGTITLMIMSLMLAGALERTGVMHQLMKKVGAVTNKRFGLIATTLLSAFGLSYFAADPYLAMLLPANALGEKYDEQGIDRRVLSRTLEDGATVVCPMVPWGTSGIYCAATLGISVMEYLPYYIMGFATPVFSLIWAATGFGIFYTAKNNKK